MRLIPLYLLLAGCTASAHPLNGLWQCFTPPHHSQARLTFAADGSVHTAMTFQAAGVPIHGRFRGTWRIENDVLLREEQMLPHKRADAPRLPRNQTTHTTRQRVRFDGADKMVLSGETEWTCTRLKTERAKETQ